MYIYVFFFLSLLVTFVLKPVLKIISFMETFYFFIAISAKREDDINGVWGGGGVCGRARVCGRVCTLMHLHVDVCMPVYYIFIRQQGGGNIGYNRGIMPHFEFNS